MIFIPNSSYIASIYENGKTVDTKYIVKGDICIVLEYFDYDDDASILSAGFPQDYRSLILHPRHGPCWTFVSHDRGSIVDV